MYTADPRKHADAEFVHEAQAGDPRLEDMAGGAGSSVSTGGMITKIIAAKRAMRSSAATVIACGREANVLSRLADGESDWHQLIAADTRCWRANNGWPIICNWPPVPDAAPPMPCTSTSLLPIGVVAVAREFPAWRSAGRNDPAVRPHEVARNRITTAR